MPRHFGHFLSHFGHRGPEHVLRRALVKACVQRAREILRRAVLTRTDNMQVGGGTTPSATVHLQSSASWEAFLTLCMDAIGVRVDCCELLRVLLCCLDGQGVGVTALQAVPLGHAVMCPFDYLKALCLLEVLLGLLAVLLGLLDVLLGLLDMLVGLLRACTDSICNSCAHAR